MKEELTARQQQATQKFNELLQQKDQKESELKDINDELMRLQGEYRVTTALLEQEGKAVSPKANVIDVDSATKGKKK